MQLLVATASGAPTRSREGALELLDPGPLGQPTGLDHGGDGVDLATAEPRLREWDLHHREASLPASSDFDIRLDRHHSTSSRKAFLEVDLGAETQLAGGAGGIGEAPGDAVDRALGAVLDREV